jgi:predicted GNAT family N-acyltransferase
MPFLGNQPYPFTVRCASWQRDNASLCAVREKVFIQEQHVPVALEWDGEDEAALHLLAEDTDGHPIGTARMLVDGHIGRVAVLPRWRGHGVGTALMQFLLGYAHAQGHRAVYLDAQVEAVDFYRRLGFQAEGDVFMDAGIPHRHMRLELST